jgi:hypothetical protein
MQISCLPTHQQPLLLGALIHHHSDSSIPCDTTRRPASSHSPLRSRLHSPDGGRPAKPCRLTPPSTQPKGVSAAQRRVAALASTWTLCRCLTPSARSSPSTGVASSGAGRSHGRQTPRLVALATPATAKPLRDEAEARFTVIPEVRCL